MVTKHKARFVKSAGAKTIKVTKEVDASVDQVWEAWTESGQLDQWWGPKPWNAVTSEMDFKEGGSWLYYMAGPKGEKQWSKSEFHEIEELHRFSATDMFTDENGNRDKKMPLMHWETRFTETGDGTNIQVIVRFDSKEDMEQIIKTGFEEGFSKGLDQLEELLAE